jgi:hypothetical protein
MSKGRVVLGASIVGVVGATVASAVLAIGPQVGSGSDARRDAASINATVPPVGDPSDPAHIDTAPSDTEPSDSAPMATAPADIAPGDTTTPAETVSASHERSGAVAMATATTAAPADPPVDIEFADPSTCPAVGRAAVVDRENQRAWLCGDGAVTRELPITTAWSQPDPGDYAVYAKDMNSSSRFTGRYSTMTHFVAFTYGKFEGARIAFHSVPTYPDGAFVQPLESVGTPEQRGNSAGCIRVLPDDAELIWSWLEIGDVVRVVS